jgi:glycosyltransferase involved in cell wall biosynthesis
MISILTPVHNTDVKLLGLCINSVKSQTFTDWEFCLVDDGSTNPATIKYLKEINHPRIKIKHLDKNVGIGLATEEAFKMSSGDFIAFMDSDDELAFNALELSHFNLQKYNADVVYSDEALISMENTITGAHFKPDYSPDLLLSQNYMCHFVMLKRDVYVAAGGLRGGYDGSQDHDFLLRVSEKTNKFIHIPEILYYWRTVPSSITHDASSKHAVWDRGVAAITESLERRGRPGTATRGHVFGSYVVRYKLEATPLVSIIIPFKENIINLKRCIGSINNSTYTNYNIIIINGSEHNIQDLSEIKKDNIKVIDYKEPFNFSKILNIGVAASQGEHVLTLHDDIFPLKNDWIEALLEHSQRPDTGCIGARLLFPNKTIQHAGVAIGVSGVCVHSFFGIPASQDGYYGRAKHIQNVSAVTGSCMMFKRKIFDTVGGFDEKNLIVDFSDIDFCLRVQKKGFFNIYTSISLL